MNRRGLRGTNWSRWHSSCAMVDLSGFAPLRWEQMRALVGFVMESCLVVNDAVKVILIKRVIPTSVA